MMNEQTKLSLATDENEYQAYLIGSGQKKEQPKTNSVVIKNLGETNLIEKTAEKGLFLIEIF